ncbi:hypothetical protein PENTCL1PPCAC_21463 [Pristionchus entomophagus]|uniref:SRCR domain-containing protein n=1 Tax=Pristionchus entomophagus TaxID=358040 RepID=A0AAV5TYV6_9BILA|nr:hypothetical protein PENTCL1PPCAC_21463 [Pristionchus entomophagus]
MRRLFFSILMIHLFHSVCPDGFDLVWDGECRGKYGAIDSFWDVGVMVAAKICEELLENTVIIHNSEHQSYWHGQVQSNSLLIGNVCAE